MTRLFQINIDPMCKIYIFNFVYIYENKIYQMYQIISEKIRTNKVHRLHTSYQNKNNNKNKFHT